MHRIHRASLDAVYANADGEMGIILNWEGEEGFGQIKFTYFSDETIICDSEFMGKEFVEAVLIRFLHDTKLKN
jgi:hypothetical protein